MWRRGAALARVAAGSAGRTMQTQPQRSFHASMLGEHDRVCVYVLLLLRGQANVWVGALSAVAHGDPAKFANNPTVHLTFVRRDGTTQAVEAKTGMSLLEVAHANDIELEGACESSMACSTCHVVLEENVHDTLEPPCEDEEDMLDMAFGLTDTSRLGCQVIVDEGFEGTTVTIPKASRNFYVDGHVPKPH